MQERPPLKGEIFLCCCLLIFVISVSPWLGFHDGQRCIQILLALGSLIFSLKYADRIFLIDRSACWAVAVLCVFGLLSSLMSHQPSWSFTEFSLVVVCIVQASAVSLARISAVKVADRLLIFFVVLLCSIKIAQFLCLTVSAFSPGSLVLDTDTLITGFSNKRFYGQFQTFTFPLLALPLLLSSIRRPAKICFFLLLSLWWMIAITGGTRGTWLGMGAAGAVLFLFVPSGRRWLGWQVAAVLLGLLLHWLTFSVLTGYLGIEIASLASDRLTTTLSGRGPIWQQAWDMIRERPWLGFGPMHFADIHNPIAAHPHQAILQWASEWGTPSALLVGALAMRGLYATFRLIRERAHSVAMADLLRLCLFASLIGALTQSMVDGVIVMPYSQLWLALVVGWLMGLHVWKVEPKAPHPALRWSWAFISVAAVAVLVFVVIRDLPHLKERNQQYREDFGGHYQPRFWTQGVIAEKKP